VESTSLAGVIDSCPGFDVIADLIMQSTETSYDGRIQIHLRLTGSLSNSTSQVAGRYAEVQVDAETRAGMSFSAGLLSKLTVPGRGTTALNVGRGGVAADGTPFVTPHAAGTDDYDAFHRAVCAALA
jgi:hypothetical protein